MKILLIQPILSYRGGERVAIHLARGLINKNQTVSIFFLRKDNTLRDDLIKNLHVEFPNRFISWLVQNNVVFLLLGPIITSYYLLKIASKYDILHSDSYPVLPATIMVGKLFRKKTVWTIHSLNERRKRTYELILEFVTFHFGSKSDAIITVSPKVERIARKHFLNNKINMIIPPIDQEKLSPSAYNSIRQKHEIDNNIPIIICVGAVLKEKNQIVLVEVAKTLRNNLKIQATIIIIGSGDTDLLLNAAKKSDLRLNGSNPQLIITGYIRDEELKDYYHSADILVMPSLEGQEGLGITPFEALFCGVYPIVSQYCGNKEIISGFGKVINPSPDEIANTIHEVLINKEKYKTHIKCGIDYINKNLSIDAYANNILKTYKSI